MAKLVKETIKVAVWVGGLVATYKVGQRVEDKVYSDDTLDETQKFAVTLVTSSLFGFLIGHVVKRIMNNI